jgi:hypothetical protein
MVEIAQWRERDEYGTSLHSPRLWLWGFHSRMRPLLPRTYGGSYPSLNPTFGPKRGASHDARV